MRLLPTVDVGHAGHAGQARQSRPIFRLTDKCIAFARSKGCKKMPLWTNRGLVAARAIYAKRAFQLIKKEARRGFGHGLAGETWCLRR